MNYNITEYQSRLILPCLYGENSTLLNKFLDKSIPEYTKIKKLKLSEVMHRIHKPDDYKKLQKSNHTKSPYNNVSHLYADLGLPVIPIKPNDKCPGNYSNNQWTPMKGWPEFTSIHPTQEKIDEWDTWPDAGIGLLLGGKAGIVAVDIDTDDAEIIQVIEATLPVTLYKKKGHKGYTGLYRSTDIVKKRAFKVNNDQVLEIHSTGQQTVMPPSIHPQGMAYHWLTEDTLETLTNLDELPELTSADLDRLPPALAHLNADIPTTTSTTLNGIYHIDDTLKKELRSALCYINPDPRENWLKVLMALHSTGDHETAFAIATEWSMLSDKYDPVDQRRVWKSCSSDAKTKVGYETILHMGTEGGWPNTAKYGEIKQQVKTTNNSLFKLIKVGDMELKPISWLIRDFIESDSLALVFGNPGCTKSFLAIDVACCISTGTDWHERSVKQSPVIYIAGEGHNGLKRRFDAWSIHHDISLDNAPLYVSTAPTALCDGNSIDIVLQAVEDAAAGMNPGLVVLDTVARNFGPGDENKTQDMVNFIAAADRIRTQYSCTVLLVHHTGHTNKDRARGAMALKGALDAEYKMTKDESDIVQLEATKMKDADTPKPMSFKLCSVELPIQDDEGNPVTSAVLNDHEGALDKMIKSTIKGKNQKLALNILKALYQECRKNLVETGDDPDRVKVSITQWQNKAMDKGLKNNRWAEVYNALVEKNAVIIEGNFALINSPPIIRTEPVT